MVSDVSAVISGVGEVSAAVAARAKKVAIVGLHVALKIALISKHLIALGAGKGAFFGVSPHVLREMSTGGEQSTTHVTLLPPYPSVP